MARRDKKRRSSLRDRIRNDVETNNDEGNFDSWLELPDGMEFFDVDRADTYDIDILPYEVNADNHPKVDSGELWYCRPIGVHYGIGVEERTVLCPKETFGERCPVCERRARWAKDPKKDEKDVDGLKVRKRVLYNVLVNGDGPNVLNISYYNFEKMLREEIRNQEDADRFADLEEGLTLVVRFAESKFGRNKFYEASRFDFEDRDPLDESILDRVCNFDECLNPMDYDELKAMIDEMDDAAPEDEEDQPSPRSRRKPRRSKPSREPEDEASEDEDPEDEASEDECPEGHEFGKDCNQKDDCDYCDVWKECQAMADEMATKKRKSKSGRRSRRK